jgi:hypothetical protein
MPTGNATGGFSQPGLPVDEGESLFGPPSAVVEPLIESRPTYLDTDRLHTFEDFELLIAQIASMVHGLRHVKFYGTRGQTQHGIDLVGVAPDATIWALQAKRHQTFGPADLREAVAKFANADRRDDGGHVLCVSTLVIAVACEARTTGIIETFYALRDEARAAEQPYDLHFWDRQDLSEQMRSTPRLVRRFFGDYTASRFCDNDTRVTADGALGRGLPTRDSLGHAPSLSRPASEPPAVLTDIVMVGPERASGADTVLSRARETVDGDPARAAELFQTAEGLLADGGFVLQAAIVSEARAQALLGAKQFSAAAEVLLGRFWGAVDRGSYFDCRRIQHELSTIAQTSVLDTEAASAAATARAALTILQIPDQGLTAAAELLTDSTTALGIVQLARLASETAAAEGLWTWLTRHAEKLHTVAAHAAAADLSDDGLRIELCIADASDVWTALLDRAHLDATSPMFSAVIQARYARRCAYRQEPTTARQMWMGAAAIAAERGWNADASEWLYAVSKLRMRFTPLDTEDDQARNSARALHSVTGPAAVYSASDSGREAGLEASQAGRRTEAIDHLQGYLRSSFASGRWVDEDDARALLSTGLIPAGRLTEAARHLVTAGITKFDELLEAAGDEYIDVTEFLQDPRTGAYWQRAAALRLLERQADLVPDDQVGDVIDFGLNVIALAVSGALVDNHPMFAPSLYLSAHAALASLADAMTVLQAERLLGFLAPLVAREPDHYRHSDESHVRSCVAIARHFPTLRSAALGQLVSLVETNDSAISAQINRHGRSILADNLGLVRQRLERSAHDGNREAIELLAAIEPEDSHPGPERLGAAEAAFTRLTAPIVHVPGTYSVGTGAPTDAVVARVLPHDRLAAAIASQFERAHDPRSPLTNRADYLAAAFNLAMKLPSDQAENFFPTALELTHDSGRSEDPLAEFGMPSADLRVNAALLCAALARTPGHKKEALRISLRLLAQTDTAGSTVAHILRIVDQPDLQTYLPLLASRREWTLRAYAASKWADGNSPDVELGLALAADGDPRVQHAFARALARAAPSEAVESVRGALAQSPYRSVRRTLSVQM